MDNLAAKLHNDSCRICHLKNDFMILCNRCGLSRYCSIEHQTQHRPSHSELCIAYEEAERYSLDTKQHLFARFGGQFDLFDWSLAGQLPGNFLQCWHKMWADSASGKANLLAHWDTRDGLVLSLDTFLRLRDRPFGSPRMVDRIIPNLQLRLGKLDDCLETLLDAVNRQTGHRSGSLDILSTPLMHANIGFQFIVIVLKIIALRNLRDVSNVALVAHRLPVELVERCQEEAMAPLTWTMQGIRKGFGSIGGLSPSPDQSLLLACLLRPRSPHPDTFHHVLPNLHVPRPPRP